ncbi:MAG TPA: hypothetical protein VEL74_01585 [Thermoanaerobaculia bacterium]|nr:hypothetical protein [Thermoanaerobaculia bacterium]
MKKTKKLMLNRETLRTMDVAGGDKPGTHPELPNTMVTSCDYTYSCREWSCTCPVQLIY